MNNNTANLKKLSNHRFQLTKLIQNPDLKGLLEESGAKGESLIQMHNLQGRYLSGDYMNKGYSTTTLPVFYFGSATLVERTGNLKLSSPEKNISNIIIKKDDIEWKKSKEGKKVAYLRGGYATFLKYTRPGKNLSKVDHTFTGQMLNALTHDIAINSDGGSVEFYVRSPHEDKAYYTNLRREWMGFFDDEIQMLAEMASEGYGLIISDMLSFE